MTGKQKISLKIITLLLSAVLVLSEFMVFRELSVQQKEKDDFTELKEIIEVTESQPPESITPIPDKTSKPKKTAVRDLSKLFAANDDCIGWICIPDTAVNYPVMHTPENPQKYLRKNFKGKYSVSGVPFMDGRCTSDSDNIILYGHNMRNGTMFASLRHYTKQPFCAKHRVIEFQTAEGLKLYRLFAVLKTNKNDEWYNFITAEERATFEKYISGAKSCSLYKSDFMPEYGHQLFTLSTCYGRNKNNRLLIIAAEE